MDEPQIPEEHFPPDWVFDEGYRIDAYHVPLKGEEIWSPGLQTVVRANGEETHPRVTLVFVGQEVDTRPASVPTPTPAAPARPSVCAHCGAPYNLLPFPMEVWHP